MQLVLDIECKYQITGSKTDPSPYCKGNKLVSVGVKSVCGTIDEYLFFSHKEKLDNTYLEYTRLQNLLDSATLVIGHNLKFDMSWLFECNFKYSGKLFDTMIMEYLLAKGQKPSLSLHDCAIKYGLTPKLDIFKKYKDLGINTDAIPMDELEEYGRGDIITTLELYVKQQKMIADSTEVQSMMPAIELSMQVLPVLIQMERDGIYINQEDLKTVELEYRIEAARLEKLMNEMVLEVMGHRPINLNSSEHLSWVIYSRRVKDKKSWADIFNIGTELRGNVWKQKYPRRYSASAFKNLVVENMETLYKQDAAQCSVCEGRGYIQKVKKDGTNHKRTNSCTGCSGSGFTYTNEDRVAGFRVKPIDSTYAASSGFATDKQTILDLIATGNIKQEAKEFLGCLSKYNAIQTYLSTFVEGIQKNIREDMLLHTSLNQCITATGRLSSSNPNFQNLPRGNTFPVRKVIQSRFKGGLILDADWSGLEFRTAVALSKDMQGKADIDNGADVHQFTADTITSAGKPTTRQQAKTDTFRPLFGGMSGTPEQVVYYQAFVKKYAGIGVWQEGLVDTVLRTKQMQSPSGRIYAFPNAKRIDATRVTGKTQIYNYMIQGFATGDLMPLALVKLYENMKGLQSKLVLTVHDSVVIDVHPEEKDQVIKIVFNTFGNIHNYLKEQFNFESIVEFAFEVKIGTNWLNMEKIKYAA